MVWTEDFDGPAINENVWSRVELGKSDWNKGKDVSVFVAQPAQKDVVFLYRNTATGEEGYVLDSSKTDGTTVKVNIGEDLTDPVFCISDILPHLAQDQMKRTASEIIKGEELDVIIGSIVPSKKDEKSEKEEKKDKKKKKDEKPNGKKVILELLKKKYGIEEKDLESAELEIVPAGSARDLGLDRSLILGYGHDDRVCAFPSAVAMLEVPDVKTTACGLFVDKEEIGSVGATGMESHFFEDMMREVLDRMGIYSELNLTRCFRNSRMLSSAPFSSLKQP